MNCKPSIFILLFASFFLACKSTVSKKNRMEADDYTSKIDSLLQTRTPRAFNGVVMISQKGKLRYTKANGYSDFEKKIPLNLEDKFRIQSNSKQITAVLILKEVEKGKLRLESPIKTYLPELAPTWADSVTVHQLLNMSAGIVSLDKPLSFKPGTNFHYSNPAYGLLGQLIEKINGKTFTEVANDLFKSLGMNNTYCYELNKPNPGLINSYWLSKDSVELVRFDNLNFTEKTWANFVPAGGIISNAIDLNIWDVKLHTGKILQPNSYRAMVNSNIVDSDFTFSEKESNYGYGVNINEGDPVKYIGHAGRGIGFVSLKIYIPARDLDLIILENTYDRDLSKVYHFEKSIRQIVMNSSLVK